jgi:arylsulfatase A-like enzyme
MKRQIIAAFFLCALCGAQGELRVPAFTAYLEPDPEGARVSASAGVSEWKEPSLTVLWFGDIKTPGRLDCSLLLRLPVGEESKFRLRVAGTAREASVKGMGDDLVKVAFGSFDVPATGFQRFTLESLNGPGQDAGDLQTLMLDGPAAVDAHFNLKARRNAASVHLFYPMAGASNVDAFYCEVTGVETPLWTYFEACGWHRGYLGMQVNSPTERRIIFSVWDSGQEGVDRNKVGAQDRVTLVAKGDGVLAGDFGNEGTGGHSHLVQDWKSGQKQRFLVTAKPRDATHTVYAGYWFEPEQKKWRLISSWNAPKDGGYLHGLYSFCENFGGSNGQLRRKALYGNQWFHTSDGQWHEQTAATFSHDPTGKADRLDRFMGVEEGQFFLSTGGFVPGFTKYGAVFTRPASGHPPTDFMLPPFSETARKPNIVFVLADDLGYGDSGPFGQKIIHTPTLDRLAREGMKFTQHYAGSPVCAPSRCVLLTGKHPGHAFIRDNHEIGAWYSFQGQMPIPATEGSMAAALKSAGYATGAFGKWGLGGVGSPGDPLKHGFDHFFGFNDQRQAHNYFPQSLDDDEGRLLLTGNTNVSEKEGLSLPAGADPNEPASYASFVGKEYAPDFCCERALQFIRDNQDRPFFLYYPTTVPHLALQVPEDSLEEYKGKLEDKPYTGGQGYLPQQYPHAAYAAMVTRMDRDIGRMAQLVRDLGLEDNTIFIFTSDNGAALPSGGFDPAYFNSNGELRGYKGEVYEGGIREPLIVSWKDHIPGGTTSTLVTGFEDWLPTLLELAGAPEAVPKNLDGISFAPTLLGGKQPERPFLYREFHGADGQQAVRVGDWKLIRRHLLGTPTKPAAPTTELYNLAADPSERQNAAAAHPDIVAKLEKLLSEQHVPSKEFPIPLLDKTPGK